MKKYKIRMIISILVAIMLLAYMIVPMKSMADNKGLNMELTKVEINGGYQINVTGSSTSKIIALSYINDRKTVTDFNSNAEAIIAYFEGDKATKLKITSDNYINEIINVGSSGNYTFYLRNVNGEIQLAYITINDKTAITVEAISQVTSDCKSILIKANSTSNITAIKVLKTENATAPANFTNVTNLLNTVNTTVEITYPIIEDGIYQIYVEDANKNKKIQTINIFEGETPISIGTIINGTRVTINVKDAITNIQTIKIAPRSEISAISDFGTKGTELNFEGTNNITIDYDITTAGEYLIYAKDTTGNSFMKSINIEINSDQNNKTTEPIIKINPIESIHLTEPIRLEEILETTQPTQSEQPAQPAQPEQTTQPTETTQLVNIEETLVVANVENDKNDVEEFEQIPDKTTISTKKTDAGIQIVNKDSMSGESYPQTGTNDYIILAGILISTVIAIVSYIKMKQE